MQIVSKLLKGENYSREETIQGGDYILEKSFDRGDYSRGDIKEIR